MNKAAVTAIWERLRFHLKSMRRLVDQIPEDKLGFRATPEVRSAAELVSHVYIFLTNSTESVLAGKHIDHSDPKFTSKAELLEWMDRQVESAYANLDRITDEQLSASITAWGQSFPGWQMVSFVQDEVIHHRGQLTVYLRLMGIQPAFIYGD